MKQEYKSQETDLTGRTWFVPWRRLTDEEKEAELEVVMYNDIRDNPREIFRRITNDRLA